MPPRAANNTHEDERFDLSHESDEASQSARQAAREARVERAREIVAQSDAQDRARQRRASIAHARKVTAARLALAEVIESGVSENPQFADQIRRRAMQLLPPNEFNLVASHLDTLTRARIAVKIVR